MIMAVLKFEILENQIRKLDLLKLPIQTPDYASVRRAQDRTAW